MLASVIMARRASGRSFGQASSCVPTVRQRHAPPLPGCAMSCSCRGPCAPAWARQRQAMQRLQYQHLRLRGNRPRTSAQGHEAYAHQAPVDSACGARPAAEWGGHLERPLWQPASPEDRHWRRLLQAPLEIPKALLPLPASPNPSGNSFLNLAG